MYYKVKGCNSEEFRKNQKSRGCCYGGLPNVITLQLLRLPQTEAETVAPKRSFIFYKALLRTRALDLWITRACRALTNHMRGTRMGGEKAWETLSCKYLKNGSLKQLSWAFWIPDRIRSGHSKDRIPSGKGPI